MTRTHRLSLTTVLLLLAALPAFSQVQTGTPPFGSFSGGPDVINVGNNNTHLTIPVRNKAGRGMNFTYNLAYDSSIWYPLGSSGNQTWQYTGASKWGWTTSMSRGGGAISRFSSVSRYYTYCGPNNVPRNAYITTYTYYD